MGTLTTGQAIALAAASTAAQAGMQVMSAKGQSQQAKMQAELARRQADRERQIGAMQAQQQREKNKRTEGTQRALLAARGGDTGTGSALLVQGELAEEGEFNARLQENNAAARASGFEAESVLQQARARQARAAGLMRAGSTLLSGASDIGLEFRQR